MTDRAGTVPKTLLAALWDSPILLLASTALIWAGHALIARLAVGEIAPMTLTCARWGLALGPIAFAARGTLKRDLKALKWRWGYVVLMGGLGFTAFNALFYAAAHYTGALNLSIIQGSSPALVLLGARMVFGVRVGVSQTLGALVTMVGVAAIASQGEWARLAALQFNFGDALMLIASAIYAGYTLGLRNRPAISGFSFLAAMAFVAFVTSIPLMAREIAQSGFVWPSLTGYALLAYAALGPAFLAQVLFMRGVQLIGPNRAGVFINLVPLFGALMSVLLLGETFALYHVIALALVVGGIVLAQRGPGTS